MIEPRFKLPLTSFAYTCGCFRFDKISPVGYELSKQINNS